MDKKLLLALLAATPVTFNAFADSVVPGQLVIVEDNNDNSWKFNGINGSLYYSTGTDEDRTVESDVAITDATYNLGTLVAGDYRVSFTTLNNLTISIKGDNVSNVKVNGSVATFTVTADGNASVVLKMVNAKNDWKFGGGKLEVVYDFAAAQTELAPLFQAVQDETPIVEILKADTFDEAKTLRQTYNSLVARYNEVKAAVDGLQDGNTNAYTEYKDWDILNLFTTDEDGNKVLNEENPLVVELKALPGEIEDYNADANAENARWNYYTTNTDNKDSLLGGVTTLEANLKAAQDVINASKDNYIKETLGAQATEIANQIAAYKGEINTAFANCDTKTYAIPFTSKQPALQALIDELNKNIANATPDNDAYKTFINEIYNPFNAFLPEIQTPISGLDVNEYPEWQANALNIYNSIVDGLMVEDLNENIIHEGQIPGAEDKLAATTEAYKEAKTALLALKNSIIAAKAAVDGISNVLDEVKADDPAQNVQNSLKSKLDTLEGELSAIKATVAEELAGGKDELQPEDYDATAADLQTRADNLKDNVDNFNTNYNALQTVQTTLNNDKTYVVGLLEDAGLSLNKFDDTFDNIQTLIDQFMAANQSDLIGYSVATSSPAITLISDANIGNMNDILKKAVADAEEITADFIYVNHNLNGYTDADGVYHTGLLEDLASFKTALENKVAVGAGESFRTGYLKGTTKYPDGGVNYPTLEETINDFNARYGAAKDLTNQELYTAVKDLQKEMANLTPDDLATDRYNTLQQISLTSVGAAEDLASQIQAIVDANPGKAGVAAAQALLNTQNPKLATEKGRINNPVEYEKNADGTFKLDEDGNKIEIPAETVWGDADGKVKAIYDALNAGLTEAKKIVPNYNNYVAVQGVEANVQAAIDAATQYVKDNTIEPAVGYYINTVLAGIQDSLDALKASDKTAYEGVNIDTTPKKQALIDELNKLITNINTMKTNVVKNEKNHNVLVGESDLVENEIQELVEWTHERQAANPNADAYYQSLIEEVRAQFTELNNQLYDAFGHGGLENGYNAFMTQYEDLRAELTRIKELQYDGSWKDQVAQENDKLLADFWNLDSDLWKEYKDAIDTYNQYLDALTNTDYREGDYTGDFAAGVEGGAEAVIKDHEGIYKYSDKIRELEAAVKAAVNAANNNVDAAGNEDPKELTPEQISGFEGQATTMTAEILDALDKMKNSANTYAEEYYDYNLGLANGVIDAIKAAVANTGVTDEVLEEELAVYMEYIQDAEDIYNSVTNPKFSKYTNFGQPNLVMSEIADKLQKVTGLDVNTVAQEIGKAQWNADIEEANATIADYEETLAEINKTGDSVVETYKAAIEALNNASATGAKFYDPITNKQISLGKLTLATLADYQAQLKKYMGLIDSRVNALVNADANNKAYQNYNDVVLPNLANLLADLNEYAQGLAVESYEEANLIPGLQARINSLKSEIDRLNGEKKLPANETQLATTIQGIEDAIANGYKTICGDEQTFLKLYTLHETKVAYNNVNTLIDTLTEDQQAEVVALNKEIDGLETALNDFTFPAALAADATDEEVAAYNEAVKQAKADLLSIQTRLAEILYHLENDFGAEYTDERPSVTMQANAAVNAQKDVVESKIALVKGLLAGCEPEVQDEYGNVPTDLESQLSNLMDEWDNLGSGQVVLYHNYVAYLKALAQDCVDQYNAIKAANDAEKALKAKKAASDKQYNDVLNPELTQLEDNLEALQNFYAEAILNTATQNPHYDAYEWVRENYNEFEPIIAAALENARTWLDNAKANYSLTAESALPIRSNILEWLSGLTYDVTSQDTQFERNETRQLISDTNDLLQAIDHVTTEVLNYSDFVNTLNNIQEEYYNVINGMPYEDENGLWKKEYDVTGGVATDIDTANWLVEQYQSLRQRLNLLQEEIANWTYEYGDVNRDGSVDVQDLSDAINRILNDEVEIDPNDVIDLAMDMNGDGILNIADAVAILQRALGYEADHVKRTVRFARPAQHNTTIAVADMAGENGTRFIEIELNNEIAFVAGQLDIKLAPGMRLVDESLTNRTNGMNLVTSDLADGTHRVVIMSNDMEAMAGANGAIIRLQVEGEGEVAVENAAFADAKTALYKVGDASTSGVNGIMDNMKDGIQRVYDAAGRVLNKVQNGLNIIVNGNGKTSKEIRK